MNARLLGECEAGAVAHGFRQDAVYILKLTVIAWGRGEVSGIRSEDSRPSRHEVVEWVRRLIDDPSEKTRDEACGWAYAEISRLDEGDQVDDLPAWHALTLLLNADAATAPGEFLYFEEDFRDWIKDIT